MSCYENVATQIPPSPEHILCMMNDLYVEAKADGDRSTQLKLFPMMSRVSMYLHAKKHRQGHYITSPEAVRTLTASECMTLMDSIMAIGQEQIKAKDVSRDLIKIGDNTLSKNK